MFEDNYQRLAEVVRRELQGNGRKVVVFDADGTLWRGDVGEAHLRHLDPCGQNGDEANAEEPHLIYAKACEEDIEYGYRLGTQLLAPRSELEVLRSCEDAWGHHRSETFAYVQPILDEIRSLGGECWVVSASHRWIIEVAVKDFGIPSDRVIAGDLWCDSGHLTERVKEPFPNGPGKAAAIHQRIGVKPRIAFGNSMHDVAMMECASTGVVLWDKSSRHAPLITLAKARGWFVYEGRV